jgi:hypothetical protein
VQHFIEERAEVKLVCGETHGRFGSGREQMYSCLRRLALVKPDEDRVDSETNAAGRAEIESVPQHKTVNDNFVILLTTAKPGTIPANIWRTSHVLFL